MGSASDEDLRGAAAVLRQGVVRLGRRLRSERGSQALSPNKVSVLAQLSRLGPLSASSLAAAERQQPQALTRVLADLEDDGLITRSRDRKDGRSRILHLTPAGRDALVRDMAVRDEWLATAMLTLTETERGLLVLAGRLIDRLADTEPAPDPNHRPES
ncbi:MAG TPA: MarR family transcriptional regulator [Actinocrinis sp.]|jgi:DNA-binding MarR family transcriptional regulator